MGEVFKTISNIIHELFQLVIELIRFLTNNLFILVFIVVLVLGYKVYKKFFKNRKKEDKFKVNILSSTTLEKIILMNDLSVMRYPFSNIATIYEEDNTEHELSDLMEMKKPSLTKPLYKVKYNGTVSIGFDVTRLNVGIDKIKKMVIVKLPELNKIEPHVDIESIELAFMSPYLKDYKNTDFINNAYKVCIDDMKYKVFHDKSIKDMARVNAINTMYSIIKPIISDNYSLVIN